MLETLRRHSQSYLVYLFFGVIIVVFVFFFGPQSDGCSPSQATQVATVQGESVLSLQIEQLYARIESSERGIPAAQRLGPGARRRQLTEDIALIRILAEEARDVGLAISDAQFTDYVRDSRRNADFAIYTDRNGEFDLERYELTVPGTFGLSLQEYEAFKEDELLARLYLGLLAESIIVTPDEVESLHRLRSTEYDLEFIRLEPEALAELFAVTDDEVAAALTDDRERVEAYYAEHGESFAQPRTLRVRRIFIRLPGESDPDGRTEAQANFDEALRLVNEDPESFPDVAALFSQSTDAERGGDMGLKPVGDYVSYPFMEDRIDELAVGEVATYESQVSRIIFRIEEDNPAANPPFEEVGEEVARALLESERDESLLRELAEWFRDQGEAGLTLEEAAIEHARLRSAQTAETPADDAAATEGGAADSAEETEASEADDEEADEAVALEEPDAETDADDEEPVEPLVDVRRTGPFALDDPGMDLSQFGPQFVGQRSPPREPTRIPRIGDAPALAQAISQLTEEAPMAPDVYEVEDALVVARLVERRDAPEELDEDTFNSIRDGIWAEKTGQLLGNWELRLFYHRPVPLGTLLHERLRQAFEEGDVSFNERYFVEPELEQPAS